MTTKTSHKILIKHNVSTNTTKAILTEGEELSNSDVVALLNLIEPYFHEHLNPILQDDLLRMKAKLRGLSVEKLKELESV